MRLMKALANFTFLGNTESVIIGHAKPQSSGNSELELISDGMLRSANEEHASWVPKPSPPARPENVKFGNFC